ncbi:methyltransferase domain-containing protein [Novosphingobium sp.]|uniref:methyltransferase domain-containing protein n=1 Tax=Novosphingobium sp. TaxID=1874826 RepID=UPI0025F93D70|nr:methyltransferase domain-containing protein [Novosphingobium sp.]
MARSVPSRIFDPARRVAARRRAQRLGERPDAARYVLDDMVEDVIERLSFLRHAPRNALLIGDRTGALGGFLRGSGCTVLAVDAASGFAEEHPFPASEYDFVASLCALDCVNDPVGALIHMRGALAPGGLALASLVGAGSLDGLRRAMLTADGDRPAPRLHPMIDVRAGAQLLQRAGWANPVVDTRSLNVRFSDLSSLVADLRAQALGNCLARPGPALSRDQLAIAAAAFGHGTTETFEVLTLTGWKS